MMTDDDIDRRYALATHTVMDLVGYEQMDLEDAVWEAWNKHRLGLNQLPQLMREAHEYYGE